MTKHSNYPMIRLNRNVTLLLQVRGGLEPTTNYIFSQQLDSHAVTSIRHCSAPFLKTSHSIQF
jgi:hypothetical protein